MNKILFTILFSGLATLLCSSLHAGEITNKFGMTMVEIPAGSFLMGSCKESSSVQDENKKRAFLGQAPLRGNCAASDSEANGSEAPQHRVAVRAFGLGRTEVTLGQFKKFIASAGRADLVTNVFMKYNNYGDNAPVVNVSWHDANAFIDWLNKTDGGGYRLPSEAEWEYACLAGGQHKYCGSDTVNIVAWYERMGGEGVHQVASKQANGFGLYDMSGNAAEWVKDCFHDNYSGAPSDGSAWTNNCYGDERMQRGGAWSQIPSTARAAYRNHNFPSNRSYDVGFRLAKTL